MRDHISAASPVSSVPWTRDSECAKEGGDKADRPVGVLLEHIEGGPVLVVLPHAAIVLVEADGEPLVKVLDFCIAKRVDVGAVRLRNTNAPIGTPLYMSPEQAPCSGATSRPRPISGFGWCPRSRGELESE